MGLFRPTLSGDRQFFLEGSNLINKEVGVLGGGEI